MCKVTDASDSYLSDDDSVLSSTDHLEDSPDVSENELKSGPETAGQDRVADEETARIKRLRLAVLVLIVIVGTLVAASAFYFLNRSDKGHVQDDFIIMTSSVGETARLLVEVIETSMATLSSTIVAMAAAESASFPLVALPVFEAQAAQVTRQTGVRSVAFMPLVDDSTLESWRDNAPAIWPEAGVITPYPYAMLGDEVVASTGEPFLPVWQSSPSQASVVNFDMHSLDWVQALMAKMDKEELYSELMTASQLGPWTVDDDGSMRSAVVHPILDGETIVGVLVAELDWNEIMGASVPPDTPVVDAVLTNTCGDTYSYRMASNGTTFVGEGATYEARYWYSATALPLTNATSHCDYTLTVYQTLVFTKTYATGMPFIFTGVTIATFSMMALFFVLYDAFLQKRNSKVVSAAARSDAILSSLFPKNVRDRLFAEVAGGRAVDEEVKKASLHSFFQSRDKRSDEDAAASTDRSGKPIADLFPETSVLFGDIAGFTAWCSVREPAQVFTLLETLYHAFDEIARRRRVFKVETVGDCYVAVTGLPDPRKDHAVVMARFARDCMQKMRQLTKKLEVTLGPDTGDLCLRVGIHSGPVTAGVLRGERSRFQLFGDTMNTAARMESTGLRDRIQISQETADLLNAAGKGRWLKLREDRVVAKGKGVMQTYFLIFGDGSGTSRSNSMSEGSTSDSSDIDHVNEELRAGASRQGPDSRTLRLVEWNVDVLIRLLKQIVARRRIYERENIDKGGEADESVYMDNSHAVIDEVKEIITLPKWNHMDSIMTEADNVVLEPCVVEQLYDYVRNVAVLYPDNPFHNFEHASHVTMSVSKLLSRIVAPSVHHEKEHYRGEKLHDHTYGITSDPLTQFSCVLSALIHDVDHPGVPNAQLVKEGSTLAKYYKNQSIAEQNSVDLAWNLLMDESFQDLRNTIYTTESGLRRFRQLVVNSVMATDIVDKELKTLRNARWAKAFSEDSKLGENPRDTLNRKATIVIEHLIQASDVAHTMQHWHVYRKWNERFFLECYKAWKEGRAEKNPADTWYEGEIGFFDFYIIPLARKLKDCGVFGVSSDEYLIYALRNRQEWEARGREVVDEMVEKVNQMNWEATQPTQDLDMSRSSRSSAIAA